MCRPCIKVCRHCQKIPIPDASGTEYLPTFTIKINFKCRQTCHTWNIWVFYVLVSKLDFRDSTIFFGVFAKDLFKGHYSMILIGFLVDLFLFLNWKLGNERLKLQIPESNPTLSWYHMCTLVYIWSLYGLYYGLSVSCMNIIGILWNCPDLEISRNWGPDPTLVLEPKAVRLFCWKTWWLPSSFSRLNHGNLRGKLGGCHVNIFSHEVMGD